MGKPLTRSPRWSLILPSVRILESPVQLDWIRICLELSVAELSYDSTLSELFDNLIIVEVCSRVDRSQGASQRLSRDPPLSELVGKRPGMTRTEYNDRRSTVNAKVIAINKKSWVA